MACNCGKRRINGGLTSVNQPESQVASATALKKTTPVPEPTQRQRVEAARRRVAKSRG